MCVSVLVCVRARVRGQVGQSLVLHALLKNLALNLEVLEIQGGL